MKNCKEANKFLCIFILFISCINSIKGACSAYGHSCYGAHGKKSLDNYQFADTGTPRSIDRFKTFDGNSEKENQEDSAANAETKPKLQKYILLNLLLDKDDLNANANELTDNLKNDLETIEDNSYDLGESDSSAGRMRNKFKTPLNKRRFLYRFNHPQSLNGDVLDDLFVSPYRYLVKPKRIQLLKPNSFAGLHSGILKN